MEKSIKITRSLFIYFAMAALQIIYIQPVLAASEDTCTENGGLADCKPPEVGEFTYLHGLDNGLFNFWTPGSSVPAGCVEATPQTSLDAAAAAGFGVNIACFGASICSGKLVKIGELTPVIAGYFPNYSQQAIATVYFETIEAPSEPSNCGSTVQRSFEVLAERRVSCPFGYSPNFSEPSHTYCYRNAYIERPECRKGACPTANPIDPLTGAKLRTELDYQSANGNLSIIRHYNSHSHARRDIERRPSLGDYWWINYESRLFIENKGRGKFAYLDRPDGATVVFEKSGTQWLPLHDKSEKLIFASRTESGVTYARYIYQTRNNELELYSIEGYLTDIVKSNGSIVNLIYELTSAGIPRLAYVKDNFGRKLSFNYIDEDTPFFNGFKDLAGNLVFYGVTYKRQQAIKNLNSVLFQDKNSKRFMYGEGVSGAGPMALTGIIDENGKRYASFEHSMYGSAVSSELAGGVDKYLVWEGNGGGISTPLGERYYYSTENIGGLERLTSIYRAYRNDTSNFSYDAQGNLLSQDDYSQNRICYDNEVTRGLEITAVHGLSNNVDCKSVVAPNAALPSEARKTHTQWHPDWRLPTRMAAPGRITTWVYNGQPDPTAGNAVATCAPASAVLPNSKPIAVVCKVVVQATADANGGAGFAAAAQPGVPARTWAWTYNQWGQVLTADGPRTDVADRTTYTYHAATAFSGTGANAVGVTQGDLASITNAAGQTTRFTQYDKHGHWREAVDANGIATQVTYDARQRPTSITTAGEVTTFTYDKVGQLVRTTAPDGSYVQHTYDAAHRLIASADNLGNRVDYTLDNAGNRTAERYKDPSGSLRRQVKRQFDALGRLTNTVGAP